MPGLGMGLVPRGRRAGAGPATGVAAGWRVVEPSAMPAWDEIFGGHPSFGLFHGRAWSLALTETYGFRNCHLARGEGDGVWELWPMMEAGGVLFPRRGVGLPFSDVCEPLVEPGNRVSAFAALRRLASARGWKTLQWRGGPRVSVAPFPSMSYLVHGVSLSGAGGAVIEGISDSARRAVQKAERSGVEVEIGRGGEVLEAFYRLHCQTRRRHGVPPQPVSWFRSLQRQFMDRGSGWVFLASRGGRAIAGAVFFGCGRRAYFKYGASDLGEQQHRPANLVMARAMEWFSERNYEWLDLGRTSRHQDGLRRFKLAWGGVEASVEYFKYDLERELCLREGDPEAASWLRWSRRLPSWFLRCVGEVGYRCMA